jgi:sugar phosphate isomerase/epimerase
MAVTRRDWLAGAAVKAAALWSTTGAAADAGVQPARTPQEPFGYCLNTSTLSGQRLGIVETIEVAARAGYSAIEPWIRELEEYVQQGGNLKELGRRLQDRGLSVPSVIGFAEWIVEDDQRRRKGLEEVKRCLEMTAQIGGQRLAAPPAGAVGEEIPPDKAAQRYRAILELGRNYGVVPQLEIWGFSRSVRRLGEALHIAAEADHPDACILADIYHLYKGGSSFHGLKLLGPGTLFVLHCNDYPAQPARVDIRDEHRVYPGDGVAPLAQIFRHLRSAGFSGWLSLELFNRDYWKQEALHVARTGLEKMRAAVRSALA